MKIQLGPLEKILISSPAIYIYIAFCVRKGNLHLRNAWRMSFLKKIVGYYPKISHDKKLFRKNICLAEKVCSKLPVQEGSWLSSYLGIKKKFV